MVNTTANKKFAVTGLPALEAQLEQQEILPLGVPSPARFRRTLPRAIAAIEAATIQRP